MRRRTNAMRLLFAIAAGVLVLGGCVDDAPQRADSGLSRIRVALFPVGSTLPAHVALTRGMFERHGLQIELTEGQDLPAFMAALAKEQYDIVMSVPTLLLIGAEKHLDLQIIAGLQRQSRERPNAVWITRDPRVESLAQLAGKAVAVPSLTGMITDALRYLLDRNGVDPSDVRLIQMPFATMGDQLQAGHVDAAVATIPFSAAIAARGFRVHDDVVVEAVRDASGGTVDTAMTSVWLASRTFASENPKMIAGWRDSLSEATAYLDANEAEARALMETWLKIPPAVLDRAQLPDWTIEMTPRELAPYITISKAVGSTKTDPDVNTLVWQGP